MTYERRKSLAEAAAASVPTGDRSFVASTALPGLKARQERQAERLSARADRFSQLLSKGTDSNFVGDLLVGRNTLTESQHTELLALASTAASGFRDELIELMNRLRALLRPLDPLLTTAQISYNHTFVGWGNYYEPTSESSEMAVETVASIFATQESESNEQPTSETIQEIEDLLMDLSDVQMLSNFASTLASKDDRGYLRMLGMSHWTNVRGDAYVHHARDLAFAIFGPVESMMQSEFGFTINEFYMAAEGAISLIRQNVNEHFRSHVEQIGVLKQIKDDLTPAQRDAGSKVFESLFDGLPDCLILTVSAIVEHRKLDPGRVRTILENLSVSVGELTEANYSGPMSVTPLFTKPFLRSGEAYVLPVSGHLLRSPHDLFEVRLLKRWRKFSDHRANTIDNLTSALLSQALPGAEVATNLHYQFDDGDGVSDFETDGIAVFENFCLIIEGKAGALSAQAQRGDLVRLQRDLGQSLDKAWRQCARVHRYLSTNDPATFTDSHGKTVLQIDRPAQLKVLYINPMLHSLGAYAHEIPKLRSLGLFPKSGSPWPVLVTDLRVIVEMISTPAELLHYIQWRMSLPIGESMIVFDELDIFGSYLFGRVGRTNLRDNEYMFFGSSTTDFDAFYAGELGDGPIQERPRKVLGDWLETNLRELANRQPPGWLESSFAILDLPLREAAELTGWSETIAYRDIAERRWIARQAGESVIVALADGIASTEVLLEIAQQVPTSERRFMVQLEKNGPRLLYSNRSSR